MKTIAIRFKKATLITLLSIGLTNGYAQTTQPDPYVQTDEQKKKDEPHQPKHRQPNPNFHPDDFASHLHYGGSFGAYFGSTSSQLQISPMVGYKVTDNLMAGIGGNYIYYAFSTNYGHYSTTIYGPTVFAQYKIYRGFFALAEYNLLSIEVPNSLPPYEVSRQWISAVPVGVGYYNGGDLRGMYFAALYDLVNNQYSPFSTGFGAFTFRIGFMF